MDEVRQTIEGQIATIEINRPERRNALAGSTVRALLEAVVGAGEDPQMRAVIITGSGDQAFCSGADIKPGRAPSGSPAREIVGNAPITLRRMKETTVKASGQPLAAALRLNEGISPYDSEDRDEGFRAFAEKRAPV